MIKERKFIILSVGPAIAILLTVGIFPLIYSIWVSFNHLNLATSPQATFAGIDNYIYMLTFDKFWSAALRTVELVVIAVTLELVIGLGFAIVLMRIRRGVTFFRSIFLLPLIISPALIAMDFRLMLNSQFGIVNGIIEALGGKEVNFIAPENVLGTMVMIDVWQNFPFALLIFYAGLAAIPESLIDASKVDGASSIDRLRHIIFPLMKRILIIVLIMRILGLIQMFDAPYLYTEGGPGDLSTFLVFLNYRTGFIFLDFGKGAALSFIILLATLPLIQRFANMVMKGE